MCRPFDPSIQLCRPLAIQVGHTIQDPDPAVVRPDDLDLQPLALLSALLGG